jgi:7-cyano-7-deazaguanine tRNA-ribosyltransferase
LAKSSLLPKPLEQLTAVADYQFGSGAGAALTRGKIRIEHSRRTGRVRFLYDGRGELLATVRAKDGYLALTQEGGLRLLRAFKTPRLRVIVQSDVAEFIRQGRNVFAKHVVAADEEIRPEGEVLIVDEKDGLLGVGKAVLTGREMTAFKTGAAVKTRHGIDE